MSHPCTGDVDTCAVCANLRDQAEEARAGRPAYGYSARDFDDRADAAAARDWASRGGH